MNVINFKEPLMDETSIKQMKRYLQAASQELEHVDFKFCSVDAQERISDAWSYIETVLNVYIGDTDGRRSTSG